MAGKKVTIPRETSIEDITFTENKQSEQLIHIRLRNHAFRIQTYGDLLDCVSNERAKELLGSLGSKTSERLYDFLQRQLAAGDIHVKPLMELLNTICNEKEIKARERTLETIREILEKPGGRELIEGALGITGNTTAANPALPPHRQSDKSPGNNSTNFSITTPCMPLSEKLKEAAAGVSPHMQKIAKELFKEGAVVIAP